MSTSWTIQFDIKRDAEKVAPLCRELGISPVTAVLLWNRGFTDLSSARAFLSADDSTLHDPFTMADMQKAVDRIERAIANKEKIVIYGDYDVDGVTSTAVLYLYLSSRGVNVSFHIPCRNGEGYGLNTGAIDQIIADKADLMITVDCGITASEEIEYAAAHGLDTVVTDHHECHTDLPRAIAVVNPRRSDCQYPFKNLAGVGVVFNLVAALDISHNKGQERSFVMSRVCREYCDLIAIGTVADVMQLSDINRYIVTLGLEALADPRRPGVAALCDISSQNGNERRRRMTSSFIGFVIAPKINAAGRLADASIAVELMLSKNREEANRLASRLVEMNRERQDEENRIFKQAKEKIRTEHDFENDPVIVLAEEDWHHGVIGIVASRITERYHLPSIMISFDSEGNGKGSGRSIKGLNLVEALADSGDSLVKFGGHELAAGLTITRDKLDEFKTKINDYARKNLSKEAMETPLDCECELECGEITAEMIDELARLEPYGVTNPVPRFMTASVTVCDVMSVGGDRHTRLTIEKNGVRMTAMYFNMQASSLPFTNGDSADILYTLEVNEYMGRRTPQMTVRDMIPSVQIRERIEEKRELYKQIIDGAAIPRSISAVPCRGEFADVYRELVSRFSKGKSRFGAAELARKMRWQGENAFVKVKLIADILCETKLIDFTVRRDPGDDIYLFRIIPAKGKTNLDKSGLYNRIRAAQYD